MHVLLLIDVHVLISQLEVIVSQDGTGSSQLLINCVDLLQRKLTRKAAQELLKTLVKEKWLIDVRLHLIVCVRVCVCVCGLNNTFSQVCKGAVQRTYSMGR